MRHEFPRAGAHADGKSTPHSQIANKIGRPVAAMAAVMFAYRPEGETVGV